MQTPGSGVTYDSNNLLVTHSVAYFIHSLKEMWPLNTVHSATAPVSCISENYFNSDPDGIQPP